RGSGPTSRLTVVNNGETIAPTRSREGELAMPAPHVKRVVVMVQENHTTDNYFRGLRPWGANVASDWEICPNPPPQPKFSAYYPPPGGYPVCFYEELQGSPNVKSSTDFVTDAAAGNLPPLVYLWHAEGDDEHAPANITDGMNLIWQSVDAVARGGGWDETVFM